MFNIQNDNTSCHDLSALAMFQSVVYGNNALVLKEKKSFDTVISTMSITNTKSDTHMQTESMITFKPVSPIPIYSYDDINISDQNSFDILNECEHKQVTARCEKKQDFITLHYIECNDCGNELYHYSETTKQNNIKMTGIDKKIIRKDDEWYENIYLKCIHPKECINDNCCKQCGQATYN
eukprot:134507_1